MFSTDIANFRSKLLALPSKKMTVRLIFGCLLFLIPFQGAAAGSITCEQLYGPSRPMIETPAGPIYLTKQSAIQLLEDQKEIEAALQLKGADRKDAVARYFRQKTQPRINVALTLANYGMAMGIAIETAIQMHHHPEAFAPSLLWIPPALFTADLMSGIFHKFLDSYASETNPVWGSPARAFRKHHEFAGNLNDISYWQNVSAFGRMMAPLYLGTLALAPHLNPEAMPALLTMLLLFSNGTEIHRQAHLVRPNMAVEKLQAWRLMLSRPDHMLHHEAPTDTDFGIINGWSNPVTRKLWPALDMIVWKTLKKMPHGWIQNPKMIPESVLEELAQDLSKIPEDLLVTASDPRDRDSRFNDIFKAWVEHHE